MLHLYLYKIRLFSIQLVLLFKWIKANGKLFQVQHTQNIANQEPTQDLRASPVNVSNLRIILSLIQQKLKESSTISDYVSQQGYETLTACRQRFEHQLFRLFLEISEFLWLRVHFPDDKGFQDQIRDLKQTIIGQSSSDPTLTKLIDS